MPQAQVLRLLLALLFTTVSADQYDQFNHWKTRCAHLSKEYRKTLTVPFHPFEREDARRCSDPLGEYEWKAAKENLHVLIANAFYYSQLPVRARAVEMLEKYDCRKDETCQELERLLRAHLAATLGVLKPEFRMPLLNRLTSQTHRFHDDAQGGPRR